MSPFHSKDHVAYRFDGRVHRGEVVGVYPEFPKAIKVKTNDLEFIVEAAFVQHWAEHEAELERQRRLVEMKKYEDVILEFSIGNRTVATLAKALKCSAITAYSRLKAARRRGLIEKL